ncbi:MAG: tRNA 2-thiouridine(34) synthase MnmA [Kiritimatiellae bacterium]|nr:tRNA 2-thiouridine(34) synthase MnmA [Kiritimatiellia bacterium]
MRVAVGLSGGVDSSVAALLLKRAGYDVVGVTMDLGRDGEEKNIAEARAAAGCLGIPLEVVPLAGEWKDSVLGYVRDAYRGGRTPNPCIRCNETVKFGLLPRWAFENLGCGRFATGHYARVADGRLFRGADRSKDQSYFLYRVARDVLSRTILPLGGMLKSEVRAIAREAGLACAAKTDSQDFCGGDVGRIAGLEDREGDIVDTAGRKLGVHRGFWHYTVGKRKGLGIGGGTPYYVVRLDAERNEVGVAFKEDASRREIVLCDTVGEIDMSLPVKTRSAGEPRLLKDGIFGVAPGQSAVFYRGDEAVGGGIIA